MENNNGGYEREIDLKELMFAVLRRWRLMVIWAVAGGLLFGGYKAARTWLAGRAEWFAVDAEEQYRRELEVYDQRRLACQRELANLTETIARQQEYLEESIFMNMSPYDIWEAQAEFFVETDYLIMPEMTYQNRDFTSAVLQAYVSALSNAQFMEQAAADLGIGSRYLRELVDLTVGIGDSGYNNLLTVRVRHPEKAKAEEMMEMLLDMLHGSEETIRFGVRDHTVTQVSMSLGAVVDLDVAQRQRAERQQLDMLVESLSLKQEEQEKLRQENPPRMADSFPVSAAKAGVKNGIMGAVLGMFGAAFFCCCGFVISDKVSSGRELKYRFSIRILGQLPIIMEGKGASGRIDQWFARLEGKEFGKNMKKEYDLIALNLLNYLKSREISGDVVVAGGASKENIRQVADELQKRMKDVKVTAGGDFLSDPESLNLMWECGCVALAEQCGKSLYGDVERELEKLADLHKELAGCILLQ